MMSLGVRRGGLRDSCSSVPFSSAAFSQTAFGEMDMECAETEGAGFSAYTEAYVLEMWPLGGQPPVWSTSLRP